MSNSVNATAASLPFGGFAGLLTIVFIVLKLTHVINWSWVWVLAPIWIGWALILLFFFLLLILAIFAVKR